MPKNPAQQDIRYEVITQEDPETGDLLIPLPPQLLREMGWKEGDELDFQIDDNGKVIVKKLSK
jgi:Antidote-toxin recognition MazE, bacterial antitoxin